MEELIKIFPAAAESGDLGVLAWIDVDRFLLFFQALDQIDLFFIVDMTDPTIISRP